MSIKDVISKSINNLRRRSSFENFEKKENKKEKKIDKFDYTCAMDYYNDIYYVEYFFGMIKFYYSYNNNLSVSKESIPKSVLPLIRDSKTFWLDQMLDCFTNE